MLHVETDNDGTYGSGRWIFTDPETGEQTILDGKKAAMLWLMLAKQGYELRPDFRPIDAFTEDSIERGAAVL